MLRGWWDDDCDVLHRATVDNSVLRPDNRRRPTTTTQLLLRAAQHIVQRTVLRVDRRRQSARAGAAQLPDVGAYRGRREITRAGDVGAEPITAVLHLELRHARPARAVDRCRCFEEALAPRGVFVVYLQRVPPNELKELFKRAREQVCFVGLEDCDGDGDDRGPA